MKSTVLFLLPHFIAKNQLLFVSQSKLFGKTLFQRFQGLFLNTTYIGAGDLKLFGDFPLGQRLFAVEAIPHLNNGLLPGLQTLPDMPVQFLRLHLKVDNVHDICIVGDQIQQGKRISILIGFDGVCLLYTSRCV